MPLEDNYKEKCEEFFDKLDSIDFKGHYQFKKDIFYISPNIFNLIFQGKTLSKPIPIFSSVSACPWCGEKMQFAFDGKSIAANEKCKYPQGINSYSIELDIPSGKMIFANDLRNWFKVQGNFNINHDIGCLLTTLAYEKVGMAHGFVSNTCPGVYKIDNKSLNISSKCMEEYWDEKAKEWLPYDDEHLAKNSIPGDYVGSICTDLWWYCIVDFDDFKYRFLDMGGSKKDFNKYIKKNCDVIDVSPGVYKVEHFPNRKEDYTQAHTYAKISWLKDSDHRNLYNSYKKINYTIGQSWLSSLKNYPTLYGFTSEELPESLSMEERVFRLKSFNKEKIQKSVALFYNYIFCTIGSGVSWHKNGWGSSVRIEEDTPDFELPSLHAKYAWYPMGEKYSPLSRVALQIPKDGEIINLNESFLKAAYEVIHCILKYGDDTYIDTTYSPETIEKVKKEQVEITIKSLNDLNKRYPGSIPEEYKDFLNFYLE